MFEHFPQKRVWRGAMALQHLARASVSIASGGPEDYQTLQPLAREQASVPKLQVTAKGCVLFAAQWCGPNPLTAPKLRSAPTLCKPVLSIVPPRRPLRAPPKDMTPCSRDIQ